MVYFYSHVAPLLKVVVYSYVYCDVTCIIKNNIKKKYMATNTALNPKTDENYVEDDYKSFIKFTFTSSNKYSTFNSTTQEMQFHFQ